MTYTFEMTRLTIGDMRQLQMAAKENDTSSFLEVVSRVATVDICALPALEMLPLLKDFVAALNAHMASPTNDTPDATRILRGMFGESSS